MSESVTKGQELMTTPPSQPPQQGWPKGKEGKELQQALIPGEQVLGWAQGYGRALLVATDHRALIIRTGIGTGMFTGRKVTSFPYSQITSVDFQTNMFGGLVQLGAGGVQMSPNPLFKRENNCDFRKRDEARFRWLVNILREQVRQARQTLVAPQPTAPNILEQIKQLAELRDAGVLSAEEFDAKKAELLARM